MHATHTARLINQEYVRGLLAEDSFWSSHFEEALAGRVSTHIGVFVEPYLGYVLDGRKSIESRFSAHRYPPFAKVAVHDVLFLKASAGPIQGICRVKNAWFYRMTPETWRDIRRWFGAALCLTDEETYCALQGRASFGTLLEIADVRSLPPIAVPKRDRRGWVIVRSRDEVPSFPGFDASS